MPAATGRVGIRRFVGGDRCEARPEHRQRRSEQRPEQSGPVHRDVRSYPGTDASSGPGHDADEPDGELGSNVHHSLPFMAHHSVHPTPGKTPYTAPGFSPILSAGENRSNHVGEKMNLWWVAILLVAWVTSLALAYDLGRLHGIVAGLKEGTDALRSVREHL